MKKDQYILAITGILDQESAHLLLREIGTLVRTGYDRISLDARDLGPVLPEGVLELRRGIFELLESLDAAPGTLFIDCVELSPGASAQFLLSAVAVENHRAVLAPPARSADSRESPDRPEASETFERSEANRDLHAGEARADFAPVAGRSRGVATLGAEGWLVDCLNCRHASRVRAPGEYACPVCGSAFRMSPAGEVVAV